MIDYLSYPKASLKRVVHPGQQVVGHRYNNVAWGIPSQLLSVYYRPKKSDGSPVWYLDPDSPKWGELLPYVEAQRLYDQKQTSTKLAPAQRAREERKQRLLGYWNSVRLLPGGDDPLWLYASDGDDVAPDDDQRFRVFNDSEPSKAVWFPRLQLRLRYGTTSLREYARRQGLEYPMT